MVEVGGREALRERVADRGECERGAGERATDAADVSVRTFEGVGDIFGEPVAEPVRRDRDPTADRLADHDDVGVEVPRRGCAARADADRVRLVDREQRAVQRV